MNALGVEVTSPEDDRKVVAIIDDDADWRSSMSLDLDDYGYVAYEIDALPRECYENLQEFAQHVAAKCDYAICDNHLQHRGYATFFGAAVVADLYDLQCPAVLVTQYQSTDDLVLKEWRQKLPAVLNKDEIDKSTLHEALSKCEAEICGQTPEERKPRRVLVNIDEVRGEGAGVKVVAFVPSWNPKRAVEFPLKIVGQDLQDAIRPRSSD
jgi:hypothetical protein